MPSDKQYLKGHDIMDKKVRLTAKEEALKNEIVGKVARHFGKTMEDATPKMIYTACA